MWLKCVMRKLPYNGDHDIHDHDSLFMKGHVVRQLLGLIVVYFQ